MKWVPVEKRLPKNHESVLVSIEEYYIVLLATYKFGEFYVVKEWEKKESSDFVPLISCHKAGLIVTAWKPIPKPYRKERKK